MEFEFDVRGDRVGHRAPELQAPLHVYRRQYQDLGDERHHDGLQHHHVRGARRLAPKQRSAQPAGHLFLAAATTGIENRIILDDPATAKAEERR